MTDLPERCVPCEGGLEPLSEAEAREHLNHVPEWTLDFPRIERSFRLKDFRAALAWVNRVGMLAEEAGHHPDFHVEGWNGVRLVLYTHAIGGLHANDFVVAKRIDELWERDRRG